MADTIVIEARVHDAGATSGLEKLRATLNGVAKSGVAAGAGGDKAAAGITRAEAASARLAAAGGKLNGVLSSTSSWLGQKLVSAARAFVFGIGAMVVAVAGFGIKAASNIQQTKIAFDTLLGSVDKGNALFKQVQSIALKTPFQQQELSSATQLLLRYGVAANQVIPLLHVLTDAAALTTDPSGNLQTLALAVGQVQSSGRLLGQDARQLQQSGVNAYAVVAAQMGITTAAATKLGQAGKISADQVLQAFLAYKGPLAAVQGGAEKLSQTLTGQLSNLKDAIIVRLADAASPLTKTLTGLIVPITDSIGDAVDKIGPPVFRLVGLILSSLTQSLPIVAPILAAIVSGLGELALAAGPAVTELGHVGPAISDSIGKLVTELVPVMPDLVHLFAALLGLLPDFIDFLTRLIPLVDVVAKVATALLSFGPTKGIIEGLLIALLAYNKLTGVVTAIRAFAAAIELLGIKAGFTAAAEADLAASTAAAAAATGGGGAAGAGATAAAAAGGGGLLAGLGTAGVAIAGVADLKAGGSIIGDISKKGVHISNPFVKHKGDRSNLEEFGHLFGDVGGNLASSARLHGAAAGRTAGKARVTSSLRTFGTTGPGSGHRSGKAFDVDADRPHAYAANIRAMGGWATVHDAGNGRHVHAATGDADPIPGTQGRSGQDGYVGPDSVVVQIENVWGQVDYEAGLDAALDRHHRRAVSRAKVVR